MPFPLGDSFYGMVSDNMKIHPSSLTDERDDLELIHADMMMLKLLNERGVGLFVNEYGITENQTQSLRIATRFGYCCACGRFSLPAFNHLKDEIQVIGCEISPRHFMSSMVEAMRFVAHEPEFIFSQTSW